MNDTERLAWLEAQAEAAYDKMYDGGNPSHATALYSDAKEAPRSAGEATDRPVSSRDRERPKK